MSKSLPISLDVNVQLSLAQTEIATDMSLMCLLVPSDEFIEADRVKYYEDFITFSADYGVETRAYWAGKAFFEQTPHPASLAVGLVSTADTPASITSGSGLDYEDLKAITDGSFSLLLGDETLQITGLDFSEITSLEDAAIVIALAAGFIQEVSEFEGNGQVVVNDNGSITINSGELVGDDAEVGYADDAESGVFCGNTLKLIADEGATLNQGHTAGDIASEAALVQQASTDNGRPIYGWALESSYRDGQKQKDFADWVNAQEKAFAVLCTNIDTAYVSDDETNIGFYCKDNDYRRVSVIYHDNSQQYPDVSKVALMLAVDYSLASSTITAKFKTLPGISAVDIDSTQLSTLVERRIDTYVLVGNNSRTLREGVQSSESWFSDDLVNLDNFVNELQVEVYNVFLRNKKVPYTNAGQMMIVSACQRICNKYTDNGTFADRQVEDTASETGYTVNPAYTITPMGLYTATTSMRAARLAPPVQIEAYLAGAMHKITINVNAIS